MTAEANLEFESLVWLDFSVSSSKENLGAQNRLRSVINQLKTFEQIDQCEQFIRSVSPEDRLTLIVSGQLGEKIVPRIHPLRQISRIFIYCTNQKKNEEWASRFSKVFFSISFHWQLFDYV